MTDRRKIDLIMFYHARMKAAEVEAERSGPRNLLIGLILGRAIGASAAFLVASFTF